jgi:hypothetical protein
MLFRSALGPTQAPLLPGVKRQGREADHSQWVDKQRENFACYSYCSGKFEEGRLPTLGVTCPGSWSGRAGSSRRVCAPFAMSASDKTKRSSQRADGSVVKNGNMWTARTLLPGLLANEMGNLKLFP